MSDSAIFFLRHYNDIDHIAPIVYRWLQNGEEAVVILLDPTYDVNADPRLELLDEFDACKIEYIHDFLGIPTEWLFYNDGDSSIETGYERLLKRGFAKLGISLNEVATPTIARRVSRRFLRVLGITTKRATRAIRETDPDVSVFEWNPPHYYAHAELFDACENVGVPTVCLPHGLNIYLDIDIHPGRSNFDVGHSQYFSERNRYDVYVSQSQYHRDQDIELGVDPDIYEVLGSARFYPGWQDINSDIQEEFVLDADSANSVRVVFMLPHWDYYVDKDATFALIERLTEHRAVQLVVKSHTRDETGLPTELERALRSRPDAEIVADIPSVSLIEWATAVVNFGSSIGIEALLQDTWLLNPSYLHENRTIFDETGAALRQEHQTEVIETIERIRDGEQSPVPEEHKNDLYQEVIYGGRDDFDVLEAYYELLKSPS